LELRLLDREELTALYQNEMTADFPHSELKPLHAMLRLMDLGRYEPLAVTDGGETVGYAMVWLPEDRKGALLEYFGVLRGRRNGGLGTKILALLLERYGQIFGEAEAPGPEASPDENDLRRRRIAFYERNGFRVLDYECALFGVRFHCLYRGPETDDRKVEAMHRGIYAGYFSPAHMERYIQLPLKPGEEVKPAPEWVEEDYPLPERSMANQDDWRLTGQEGFLRGRDLSHRVWTTQSTQTDHDHCTFCWAKFSELDGTLHDGYVTQDGRHWICPECFRDFKTMFAWTVIEP